MNDKDIEKILDLADKYAYKCQLILSSDHTSEDDVNRARKELQNEIVSLVAQYKEDAEKWRQDVELTALRVMYRGKVEDV